MQAPFLSRTYFDSHTKQFVPLHILQLSTGQSVKLNKETSVLLAIQHLSNVNFCILEITAINFTLSTKYTSSAVAKRPRDCYVGQIGQNITKRWYSAPYLI